MVNSLNNSYLQITGCYKSGTSLLFSLLDGHPDLSNFPTETSHTGYLFNRLNSDKLDKDEKIALFKSRYFRLKDEFYEELFINVIKQFDQYTEKTSYNFWDYHLRFIDSYCANAMPEKHKTSKYYMDKSPLSYLYADQIFEHYSNVKFIHIVREPKNNLSSIMVKFINNNRPFVHKLRLCWRYRSWLTQSLNFAERNQNKYGSDNYLIIKFEELVTQTEFSTKKICEFLDITYHPVLLTPTLMGKNYPGNNHEGMKFDSVSAMNIDRWKERMPLWYGAAIEGYSNECWANFRYPTEFRRLHSKLASFVLSILTFLSDPLSKRFHFHGKQSRSFFRLYAGH